QRIGPGPRRIELGTLAHGRRPLASDLDSPRAPVALDHDRAEGRCGRTLRKVNFNRQVRMVDGEKRTVGELDRDAEVHLARTFDRDLAAQEAVTHIRDAECLPDRATGRRGSNHERSGMYIQLRGARSSRGEALEPCVELLVGVLRRTGPWEQVCPLDTA